MNPREIIRGQWLALWKQFGGPIFALLVVQAALIFRGARYFHDAYQGDRFPFYLNGMFFLIADSLALGWAGMWFGLKSKSRIQAILSALVLIVLSRQLIVGATISLAVRWFSAFDADTVSAIEAALTSCVGLSIDLPILIFGRSSLLRNLREMAIPQFDVKK